jgi:hypothetical protein
MVLECIFLPLRACIYNLHSETVQKLINHLVKFIFRLNISQEIQKKMFLDQVSRVESRPPLA